MFGVWLYCMGDCVWLCMDGCFVFFGWIDDQVKICGYCVELGEVSVVVCVVGLIVQVEMFVIEYDGCLWFVIFVVMCDGVVFDEVVVCVVFVVKLFDYMVFVQFVVLVCLLVIVNGKIDCVVLCEFVVVLVVVVFSDVLQGVVEMVFVDVWQVVLKVLKVGCDDNFFEFGGDLIFVLQVIVCVCKCGVCFMLK